METLECEHPGGGGDEDLASLLQEEVAQKEGPWPRSPFSLNKPNMPPLLQIGVPYYTGWGPHPPTPFWHLPFEIKDLLQPGWLSCSWIGPQNKGMPSKWANDCLNSSPLSRRFLTPPQSGRSGPFLPWPVVGLRMDGLRLLGWSQTPGHPNQELILTCSWFWRRK